MKKYALIYNYPQHYRKSIFKKLDDELSIDFYFGDYLDWAPDIKSFNVEELRGFRKTLINVRILKYFIWQKNILFSVFKNKYTDIILYGDSFYLSNWIILLYCKIFNIKTSIWTHGLYKPMNYRIKWFNILFYNLADNILLYGNYSKKKMLELGFNEKKLIVIYNSLNYDEQLKIRKKMKLSNVFFKYFNNQKPVFTYIGRIQKIKKIELVLEALKKLKNTKYEFNFVLIGVDSEDVNLEEVVNYYDLQDNVWFYGACYDEKIIGELIFNSVAVISPGNIGLTAMHSLVYGTPCITHDNFQEQMPEFESIINGITGSFFMQNNVKDLIRCIKFWIIRNGESKESSKNNCYKVIDDFYNPHNQFNILKSL